MPATDPHAHLAGSQARTLAYAFDLCASALGLFPASYVAYLNESPHTPGVTEFAVLFLAYHAYFLGLREGVTPGKRVMNLAVLSRHGQALGPVQGLWRAVLLSLPWLLIAAGDHPALQQGMSLTIWAGLPTAGTAWLLLDLVLIDSLRDRRSLTDRLAATLVVRLPPPEPHRAPAIPMYSARDAEFGDPPRRPPER
ncbi:RDD family protein [Ideonella sp. 4Y16]|uniref:RDD family protein n=1 Tax=Ideonella alba TaxID=2824118 RepID=A0A941BF03_9BURK|nr:RDD family protein [Ideonella alba]MBQ0930542.1 RDD family protein [Ideonella alba]MBQ0945206.1 RDD family protein [Ideonella alba]